jgi:heptosyltransferase-2
VTSILMIKTGALGDVLRTTALLPGIHARHPAAELTWVTAGAALDLVRRHPLVAHAFAVEPRAGEELARLGERLARRRWDWVISLDDEESLCRFASLIPAERLSGAHFDAARGARAYSPDSAPWFDMGLLSVFGKAEADRRKAANTRSHPEILCSMLGLSVGEPALPPDPESEARVARWSRERGLSGPSGDGPVIGLNTGAGGRWPSKALSVERTVALARELDRRLGGRVTFLVLGGPEEAERNRAILEGLRGGARAVDAGTQNSMLEFSAWIARAGILVTSDSLALHVAIARAVPVVAFFAPTSAAEIELYGRGRKVASTARDACSYRPDADTSTLTVERLAGAVIEVLAERREGA